MVRVLNRSQMDEWLRRHGIGEDGIAKVVDGIDFSQCVYLKRLEPGDKLVQFRDRPSAAHPLGDLGGQWFALPSVAEADMGKLGIGHGLAGRTRHLLTVRRHVEVLESTARSMDTRKRGGRAEKTHPAERYRGPGGATQVFIPDRGLSALS